MKKLTHIKINIKVKMMIISILLIAMPLVIVGGNAYKTSVQVTEQELKDSSIQFVDELKNSMTNYLEGVETFTKYMASQDEIKQIYENPELKLKVEEEFEICKDIRKDIIGVYMATKDKRRYGMNDSIQDPTERIWYKNAEQQKKTIWTQPYKDATTNKRVLSVATPVYDHNHTFIGVLACDLDISILKDMINNAHIGNKGYPVVIGPSGNTIIHKNSEVIGKKIPVKELLESIQNKEKGITSHYEWTENNVTYEKFAVFSKLEKLDWTITANMYVEEIKNKTSIVWKNTLLVGVIALIIATMVAILFSTSVTRAIKKLLKDMKKVSEGDFTVQTETGRGDEIGQLSEHFNQMVHQLGNLTKHIQDVSLKVTASSQNLSATCEMTSQSADTIAQAIESIAKGAMDQSEETEKGANLTMSLADKFNELTEHINHITLSAEEVRKVDQNSRKTVEELREKTELNNEGAIKIEQAILDLDGRIKDIGNILETIDSIAEQTNLLALNASIEAARAGDAGRGFTVVAEQIRKLSEESRVSSSEIKEIITGVQEESSNTVNIMGNVKQRFSGQSESVIEVYDSFSKIDGSIERITQKIENINKFTNQVNEDKDAIVASIQNISAVSEETASASEEVNASMQQQAASVEEISTLAEGLNSLSEKLNTEVEQFEVE